MDVAAPVVTAPKFTGRGRVRNVNAPGTCQCVCGTFCDKLYLCGGGALDCSAPNFTDCKLMIDRTVVVR